MEKVFFVASWSGRWWILYKWLGRAIEGEIIVDPWHLNRTMDHYQESSALYCTALVGYTIPHSFMP